MDMKRMRMKLSLFQRTFEEKAPKIVFPKQNKPKLLLTQIQPKLDAIEQIRGDLNAENIEVPGIVEYSMIFLIFSVIP